MGLAKKKGMSIIAASLLAVLDSSGFVNRALAKDLDEVGIGEKTENSDQLKISMVKTLNDLKGVVERAIKEGKLGEAKKAVMALLDHLQLLNEQYGGYETLINQAKTLLVKIAETSLVPSDNLKNIKIDYDGYILSFDAESRKFGSVSDAMDDVREVATDMLLEYLKKIGINISIIRGIFVKSSLPPVESKGKMGIAYQINAKIGVSLSLYAPDIVDKILEDVDPTEVILKGVVYYRKAYSSSSEEEDGKITKEKSVGGVKSYPITNRGLPWVNALSGLLSKMSIGVELEGKYWDFANKDGALNRKNTKLVYEALYPIYKSFLERKENSK